MIQIIIGTYISLVMNTLKRMAVVLIILSGTAFFLKGQTLKERIDQAKVVKVYFKNADIVSKGDTRTQIGPTQYDSGCDNFKEKIPMPVEYTNALKQTIDLLNKGFNTTAFVAGDFSEIDNIPLASSGDLNWLKLGQPLAFYFSTSGAYYIRKTTSTKERENTLEIESYIYAFAVDNGKLKNPLSKRISWGKSPKVKTDICEDYAWSVKTFPPSSLADQFKKTLDENITDLTTREMAKYDKASKKK
jgi:hypothetical protein